MPPSLAALLYRPLDVSERALSRGFAVALAGWDVSAPHLLVAPVPGLDGWNAAFYATGIGPDGEGFEHAVELFEDELSPAVAVLDAAIEAGAADPTLLTLVRAEDVLHDEAWRFTKAGFERHFVREGEDGVERGVETPDASDVALLEEAAEEDPEAAERALRPHRGSTFLSQLLGTNVVAALMGSLFAADSRVEVRLVNPDPASIASEAKALNRVLGREDGRGAFVAPPVIAGVAQPASHAAFVRAYDWDDPHDPRDLYRELAIGGVSGTLRFLRRDELAAMESVASWADAARARLYPIAKLLGSALGGNEEALLALAADGEGLVVVRRSEVAPAGPTFGELLRYLALGWSRRTDVEEDFIGALMLRARLRAGGA